LARKVSPRTEKVLWLPRKIPHISRKSAHLVSAELRRIVLFAAVSRVASPKEATTKGPIVKKVQIVVKSIVKA
jgi:hypothetical protein